MTRKLWSANALGSVTFGFTLAAASLAHGADAELGAEMAGDCAACHGGAGISTDAKTPNLAGQKPGYIIAQLKAFRSEDRKNALMNAIAADFSDEDIENIAAHFASLPGAADGNALGESAGLDGSLMEFGEEYKTTTKRYHRKDYDDRKQVRYFRGNDLALDAVAKGGAFPDGAKLIVEIFAAKQDDDGNLIKDDDGKLVQGERKLYSYMEKADGWGDDVPEIYKNGDWRYSLFTTDHDLKDGVNEAPCMACHKPLTDTDYSFTYKWMNSAASIANVRLFRSEQPVSGVTQTGDDIALLVELFVHRCRVNRNIRVILSKSFVPLGRRDKRQKTNVFRA